MPLRPDLDQLSALVPGPVVTRFAPSPTGYLHLGHVVNAIYVWGVARAAGGRVALRIEDHDRIRSRPEFEAAILDDLDWLGFVPDDGRHPVGRQSSHDARYARALDHLRRTSQVYACECSRKDLGGGERYRGRCRLRALPETGRGLRVVMAPGPERADDLLRGLLVQTPAEQCGDLLLKDRDGHWTYQFAVTVDDLAQGMTLVIRGEDLVGSTGRQVRLARMLGRPVSPVFLHHPLVLSPGGAKMSKSEGDTGVRDLRAAGIAPSEVIGRAAAAVGLIPGPRAIPASEVQTLFG